MELSRKILMSDNSEKTPGIYKEEEFELFLRFVRLGMWRGVNLSRACSIDEDTVTAWKKRPETKKAYREAVEKVIKKRSNISDPEKLMKELNLEVDNDALDMSLIVKLEDYTQ